MKPPTEKDQAERSHLQGNVFRTNNFLELAYFIKKSALFVGNPSFPNALAEALKKERLIEVPENGNAYPLDSSGTMLHLHTLEYLREYLFERLDLKTHRSVVYSQLVRKLTLLESQKTELEGQKTDWKNRYDAIIRSKSWLLMAPLRVFFRQLRKYLNMIKWLAKKITAKLKACFLIK